MDYFRANIPSHHLFTLTGATAKHVSHDLTPNLFAKGVLSHLLGAVLHTICYPMPGIQAVPPAQRLAMVFEAVQDIYKYTNPTTELTNLRLKMFTDPENPGSLSHF